MSEDENLIKVERWLPKYSKYAKAEGKTKEQAYKNLKLVIRMYHRLETEDALKRSKLLKKSTK